VNIIVVISYEDNSEENDHHFINLFSILKKRTITTRRLQRL